MKTERLLRCKSSPVLARSLGAARSLPGRDHANWLVQSAVKREAPGFHARAAGLRAIKNGLSQTTWESQS